MRFVDDQNRPQAATVTRIEHLAEFKQQVRFRFPVANVEERRQVLIELSNRKARVENVGDYNQTIEPLHHPTQHRRFAGADFAGDDDQALAAFDAIVKIGHYFRVRRREVDEARVWCQPERQFFESKKFGVHNYPPGYAGLGPADLHAGRVRTHYVRNLSNRCVTLSMNARAGTDTIATAIDAAIANVRRRGIASASV